MQFCNDAIDERAIRLPWNRRKRNASLTTRALDKRIRIEFGVRDKRLLRLPLYPTQAGGEFGSVCFVVGDTGTTETVTRTAFFCAGTIYVIICAGHEVKLANQDNCRE